MESKNMISIRQFCIHYGAEISFVQALETSGLIHLTVVDNDHFIHEDHIPSLEKFVRLHRDLEINVPGIESISHLLGKIELLQMKVTELDNRLAQYETPE